MGSTFFLSDRRLLVLDKSHSYSGEDEGEPVFDDLRIDGARGVVEGCHGETEGGADARLAREGFGDALEEGDAFPGMVFDVLSGDVLLGEEVDAEGATRSCHSDAFA